MITNLSMLRASRCFAAVCAVAVAVSAGCSHDRAADPGSIQIEGEIGVGVEISTGETTPEGRLIFFEWDTAEGHRHRQAGLIGDYGMMVFYDYEAPAPRPVRYELYIQETRQIIRTTSLAAFAAQLDRLPRGATLDWYNTCTAGTYYGLPDDIKRGIADACTERGIVLRKGGEYGLVICTCS
jgi:hypothetical protein